jgi:hypothetical protein
VRTKLRLRVERREQALAPKGPQYFLWDDYDGTIEAKIAQLKVEKNLTPHDRIHTIGWMED